MKQMDGKSALLAISNLKKDLLMMRIKASSGGEVVIKDYKQKKKEVARLFTKLNNKKTAAN
jgi:ribosomal protein L29